MRVLLILSLGLLMSVPAFSMSTKEKVRLQLWVKGIKESSRQRANVISYPEEIERPLRKF